MSGMIGKRDETVSNKAFIVNLKKVGNVHNKGAAFMYFSLRQNDRVTPATIAEVANREKFKEAVLATHARLINPEYIQRDQIAWSKQDKYPSLYGYVFSVVYKEL